MENGKDCYWYIFEGDRILLQQQAGRYVIPCGKQSPFPVSRILSVRMFDGTEAMAASVDSLSLETEP